MQNISQSSNLSAEYYRTERRGDVVVTERFYPEEEYFWVSEELKNDDIVEVKLVWMDDFNHAIGVSFDDLSTDQPFDYCGVMFFESLDTMYMFVSSFKTELIVGGESIPCDHFYKILDEELRTVHNLMLAE
jgi:hypothetical protein